MGTVDMAYDKLIVCGLCEFEWYHWALIVVILCLLLESYKSRRHMLPKPPGPWGWPILGYLPHLGRKPHLKITELRQKFGDVFRVQFGSREAIFLNGIEVIKQAMVKQANDFAGRPDFYTFKFLANGNSMGFGDYGPRWKLHRRIAQNSLALFINKRENPIEHTIQEEAKVLVNNLCSSGDAPVNPHNEIYLSVGNIICALCFGKRYKRDDPDYLQLVRNNDEFMAFAGAGNPVDIMPWTRIFTQKSFNAFLKILETMDAFSLRKRKEHLDTYDPNVLRDVTDALIRATYSTPEEEKKAAGITDEQILTTVQELIGAGFDTISSTLQWGVLYMAMHPEVQLNAQKEIKEVIGNRLVPEMSDLESMPYVEACILETMRLSCIFPFALPHSTTCDTFLNGYHIPAKTLIFANLWSITRDEDMFQQPNIFVPERFLKGDKINRSVLENFLPYGAGRRKCPGEQLARIELFIFFVSMLRNCEFKKISGVIYSTESKYGLTLKPQDFKVHIQRRI